MTKKLTQSELLQIKERCERATPGPWVADPNCTTRIDAHGGRYGCDGVMHIADVRGWGFLTGGGACNMGTHQASEIQDANGALLAHARTDIPDLIGEIRRLQHHLYLLLNIEQDTP